MELPSGEYIMYLRKSRADVEAEARGEGETLAKHKAALYKLARHHKLNITETFEEIVSGESIFHRPEMLRLLDLVDTGRVKGVLVMDMDRLGRGNMQEQGLILGKLRDNNVLIVTPRKIYDLNNEFDEEYSEFEAFMARKELKIITRRLQRGRMSSVEGGNFIFGTPAYGYGTAYDERGERYLVPDPEQAEIVKLIFQWYTEGLPMDGKLVEVGAHRIAKRLEEMKITTSKGKAWSGIVVLQILRNEVYIGRIQAKKRSIKKRNPAEKGSKYIYTEHGRDKWIDVDGKHEPIIDRETFEKAQEKLQQKHNAVREGYQLVNPFAGIMVCGKCGFSMGVNTDKRNPANWRHSIRCINIHCDNASCRLEVVEPRILQAVEEWIQQLRINIGERKAVQSNASGLQTVIRANRTELEQLESQKMNLFDFLERKIYDEATFLERNKLLSKRIEEANAAITKAEQDLAEELKRTKVAKDIIPATQHVLKLYRASKDPQKKNILMKQLLARIEYTKEPGAKGDEFRITITPKIR